MSSATTSPQSMRDGRVTYSPGTADMSSVAISPTLKARWSPEVEHGITGLPIPPVGAPNIAFVGKMGAGKTTAANYLNQNYGYTVMHFAGLLKQVATQIWGPSAHQNREYLQKLGMAVREIDTDAWTNALLSSLDAMTRPVVIDDCRFPNEYYGLRKRGFTFCEITTTDELVRVDRLQKIGKLDDISQLEHPSETGLDGLPFDGTISNATSAEDFCAAVRRWYEHVLERS